MYRHLEMEIGLKSAIFSIVLLLALEKAAAADAYNKSAECLRIESTRAVKLTCPEEGQPTDWTHCCGDVADLGGQYCCASSSDEGNDHDVKLIVNHSRFVRKVKSGGKNAFEKLRIFIKNLTKPGMKFMKYVATNDVAKVGATIFQHFIGFLQDMNAELAQKISGPAKEIIDILTDKETARKVKSSGKHVAEKLPLFIHKLTQHSENLVKNLASNDFANVGATIFQEFVNFLQDMNAELAQAISRPAKEIIDILKNEEAQTARANPSSSGGLSSFQPPSLTTVSLLLVTLASLYQFLN